MATFTLTGGTTFAEGTTLGAYLLTQIGPEGGPPSGSAVSIATVTGGVATLAGLADGTDYVAYAANPNRYKRFRTDPAPVSAGTGSEVAGRAWAPNTAYRAGDIVTQAGQTYEANTDFTSGASFNAANWTAIGGGGAAG